VIRRGFALAVLLAVSVVTSMLFTGAAGAHAELVSSDPAAGDNLKAPPNTFSATFSETPADAGGLKVKDGCGRNVIESASVEGKSIEATIGPAQPGTWKVVYRVLSAEDGHVVDGDFLVAVAGKPDCSGGGDTKTPPPTSAPPEDTGSFPWLTVGIVTVVALGLGVGLRKATSRPSGSDG
jgi:methionine-rich copper-binding protein CopC